MRQHLRLHPDSLCPAVTQIDVEVARPQAGTLALRYIVTGRIDELRLPPVTAAARHDGLWRHTCFEAFVRATPGDAYHEFNFAPSTLWAAYSFDRYRDGMRVMTELGAPRIEVRPAPECFIVHVSLELDALSPLLRDTIWHLGLSAVIEETNGRKSYWALAHPPGKPDFHHADGFACELSAS